MQNICRSAGKDEGKPEGANFFACASDSAARKMKANFAEGKLHRPLTIAS